MDTSPTATRDMKQRRRRWPWVVLGVFLLLLVFAIDLAWAGSRAVDGFRRARDSLDSGGTYLFDGDVASARNEFGAAASAGSEASGALGQPAVTIVGWLPWFHDEIDAAKRGAAAATLAADGGTAFADAADAAGWRGVQLPGFGQNGKIDAGVIQRASPDMTRASDLLGQAEAELAPVDPAGLIPPLDRLVRDAKDEIDSKASLAKTASTLTGLLPSMLGGDSARTYLLVTLSPSDPRGAGGYPGVYGLLHVDGHHLSLSHLAPTSTIPKVPPVAGPAEAKKTWGWAGIDRIFWDTTYTPDFPTAAGFMTGIWEGGGGGPVDGVIAGDPALMASLLQVVGPVDTPAWPETISSDNVQQIVGADVYKTTSSAQSDAWEVGIGTSLWEAVLTRPWPIQGMATAMSTAVDGGHLQVWSPRQDEEAALGSLGVGGAFVTPTDAAPQVTLNGFTANRAGYFATTDVQVDHGTDVKGRPTTTVKVTITSSAPSGPPSILLGINPGDVGGKSLGTFGTDVNVYLAQGAVVTSFQVNGREETPFEWDELGAHAVSWPPFIEPGKSATVTVVFLAP